MSDSIQHECAVALLRLRKRPEEFCEPEFGFRRLALMLEKQHNRGQDGAGIAAVRLSPEPGQPAYFLEKSAAANPLADLLSRVAGKLDSPELPAASPLHGELWLGHLRYGTYGGDGVEACHPFVHQSSCLNRTLLLAGNFNLTDAGALFDRLVKTGHHPVARSDAALILSWISHHLEQALSGDGSGRTPDLGEILRRAVEPLDGAFTLCGVLADGRAFAVRDGAGIRPGFYYCDDQVAAVASERPALQTAFNLSPEQVKELPPGHAMLIGADGSVEFRRILPEREIRRCVFERIYFSRGNDADIHRERKALGRALLPQLEQALGGNFENTFFSYIPNTARISFHGLLEALIERGVKPRFGEIAVKDAKFRTFIADASARKAFYQHVYDVTYGLLKPGDTLVVLDDSIVRGNTMRNAILPMLDRLEPVRIIVAAAAPPIRYPDCYGIDMANLRELIAFEAAVALLERDGMTGLLNECARQAAGETEPVNRVRPIYDAHTREELVSMIADKLRPAGLRARLDVIFQTQESLRRCCPEHRGDWYFTGDYPTPGGFRVVNRALVNYCKHLDERAY